MKSSTKSGSEATMAQQGEGKTQLLQALLTDRQLQRELPENVKDGRRRLQVKKKSAKKSKGEK